MWRGLAILATVLLTLPATAAGQERLLGGALTCAPAATYAKCTGSRVPSWDGAPLSVDVYLPSRRSGPLPLVAILTGYPGYKPSAEGEFLMASPASWARRGYAVLTLAPRGMTASCGPQVTAPECEGQESHLADSRFEARDVQHLAAVLADEGVARPAVGVVGESYGGGTALQLAVLRDRIRLPDGSYAPWRSPAGTDLRIAAAAPLTTWSDLAGALVRNGRWNGTGPIGVPLASFFAGFTVLGVPDVRNDLRSQASLQGWWAAMSAGEPFTDAARAAMAEFSRFHSAAGVALDGAPAPTILGNGLTDDLFPVQEVLQHAGRAGGGVLAQVHGEFGGHGRTNHEPAHAQVLRAHVAAFFDHHLGGREVVPPDGVEVLVPTCGTWTGQRVRAASWDGLATGATVLRAPAAKLVTGGGDPLQGRALDPAAVGADRCTPVDALLDAPGTGSYRWPAGDRLLIGAPEVGARLEVSGAPAEYAQVAARLWDVDPVAGRQVLVSRALYRPRGNDRETFELHATAHRFGPGHLARLELLASDAPYGRPSNLPFAVRVSQLELRLPTR